MEKNKFLAEEASKKLISSSAKRIHDSQIRFHMKYVFTFHLFKRQAKDSERQRECGGGRRERKRAFATCENGIDHKNHVRNAMNEKKKRRRRRCRWYEFI